MLKQPEVEAMVVAEYKPLGASGSFRVGHSLEIVTYRYTSDMKLDVNRFREAGWIKLFVVEGGKIVTYEMEFEEFSALEFDALDLTK